MVCDDDGDALGACEVAQEGAELDELGAAFRHGGGAVARAVFVELGAVVCGDRVEDDEAYVVFSDGDGELVAQDVLLRLEVGGLDGEDVG